MTLHSALSKSSGRELVAHLFEAMAARVGAACARDRYGIDGPRSISLYLTKDGCTVNVDLDARINLSTFLGHWFFDDRRGRLFRSDFGPDAWGRPHHKATSMADHAEDLCSMIEGRFLRIEDGTAFAEDRP